MAKKKTTSSQTRKKQSESKESEPLIPLLREIHLWEIQPLRDLFWILLAMFIIWFGYYLRSIFTPVMVGLILAYIAQPLINWAKVKKDIPRVATISGILAVVVVIGVPILIVTGKVVVEQAYDLITNSSKYLDTFQKTMMEQFNSDVSGFVENTKKALSDIEAHPSEYLFSSVKYLFAGDSQIAGVIERVVGVSTYVLVMLALIPVYFFFFACHFDAMVKSVNQYIPHSTRPKTHKVIKKMDKAVAGFIRGRLIICLAMGIMFTIGWMIVGVPYAPLLGLAAGLLALAPFLSGIVVPFAVGLSYLSMTSDSNAATDGNFFLTALIGPVVVFAIVQGLEGWVMTPLIQGKSLEMSGVTVLIVVFIGGAIGGFYGLLLCIPVAACIKILLTDVFSPMLKQWAKEH